MESNGFGCAYALVMTDVCFPH